MGQSWRDDGTLPRPPGPRSIADIVQGVDELQGRGERVAFLAGLVASGELEHHGEALVYELGVAWEKTSGYARKLAQEAMADVARKEGSDALVKHLAAELDAIRRKATKDGGYGAAVQAVMGKAKLFGLVATGGEAKRPAGPAAPEVPPWLRKVEGE